MTMKHDDVFPIPDLVGKTVASAHQQAGGCHYLDEGYAQDGDVVIEFTDGTSAVMRALWCNDSTASLEVEMGSRKP